MSPLFAAEKPVRVHISLKPQNYERLKAILASYGKSNGISYLVERAVEKFLEDHHEDTQHQHMENLLK